MTAAAKSNYLFSQYNLSARSSKILG